MGEIVVDAEIENPGDRTGFERGYGRESDIRRASVKAVVDTGAAMLVLPQDVVEELGVGVSGTVLVRYADERKEKRSTAGPLTLHLCDRSMPTDCVVGPRFSEPLIGQIPLERLDLIADCANRTLGPRPESPDLPLLKLK